MSENPDTGIPDELKRYDRHPHGEMFPAMAEDGEDFKALAKDIKDSKQQEPIKLFEGKILDGWNRYRACLSVGVKPWIVEFNPADDGDPKVYVISVNIYRRHLTQDQRRDLIAQLIVADPEQSDRTVAAIAHVSPSTVAPVREALVATGKVSNLDTRKGKDGIKQPATKAKTTQKKGIFGSLLGGKNIKTPEPKKPKPLQVLRENLFLVTDDASQKELFDLMLDTWGHKKVIKWFGVKGYVVMRKADDAA